MAVATLTCGGAKEHCPKEQVRCIDKVRLGLDTDQVKAACAAAEVCQYCE